LEGSFRPVLIELCACVNTESLQNDCKSHMHVVEHAPSVELPDFGLPSLNHFAPSAVGDGTSDESCNPPSSGCDSVTLIWGSTSAIGQYASRRLGVSERYPCEATSEARSYSKARSGAAPEVVIRRYGATICFFIMQIPT